MVSYLTQSSCTRNAESLWIFVFPCSTLLLQTQTSSEDLKYAILALLVFGTRTKIEKCRPATQKAQTGMHVMHGKAWYFIIGK